MEIVPLTRLQHITGDGLDVEEDIFNEVAEDGIDKLEDMLSCDSKIANGSIDRSRIERDSTDGILHVAYFWSSGERNINTARLLLTANNAAIKVRCPERAIDIYITASVLNATLNQAAAASRWVVYCLIQVRAERGTWARSSACA